EKEIGEASGYLPSKEASLRIKKYLPDVKLIAILRNPIDRAFSHHTFSFQNGFEKEQDFEKVVEREIGNFELIKKQRNYLIHGLYYQNLSFYYDQFKESQIKIFLYDDLVKDRSAVIRGLYEFLAVDSEFIPTSNRRLN